MKKILVDLTCFEDESIISQAIKIFAHTHQDEVEVSILGNKENFLVFEHFDHIKQININNKLIFNNYDGILITDKSTFIPKNPNYTLYNMFNKDESESKVLVIKDFDNDYPLERIYNYLKRKSESPKLSLLNYFTDYKNIDYLNNYQFTSITPNEFFNSNSDLIICSSKDFDFMMLVIDGITDYLNENQEKKKSVVGKMGDYFFKNYVSHPKKLSRDTLFSHYNLNLDNNEIYLTIKDSNNPNKLVKYLELLMDYID